MWIYNITLHELLPFEVLATNDEIGRKEDVLNERQIELLIVIHQRLSGNTIGEYEHNNDKYEVHELVYHTANHDEFRTKRPNKRVAVQAAEEPEQDVNA